MPHSVCYLGHIFSAKGMSPDPIKVQNTQIGQLPQMQQKSASSLA